MDPEHNTYGNNQSLYLEGSMYNYHQCTYMLRHHPDGGYFAHIWKSNDVFDTMDTIAVGTPKECHSKARRKIKSIEG